MFEFLWFCILRGWQQRLQHSCDQVLSWGWRFSFAVWRGDQLSWSESVQWAGAQTDGWFIHVSLSDNRLSTIITHTFLMPILQLLTQMTWRLTQMKSTDAMLRRSVFNGSLCLLESAQIYMLRHLVKNKYGFGHKQHFLFFIVTNSTSILCEVFVVFFVIVIFIRLFILYTISMFKGYFIKDY